jgi:hypothetical protein
VSNSIRFNADDIVNDTISKGRHRIKRAKRHAGRHRQFLRDNTAYCDMRETHLTQAMSSAVQLDNSRVLG